MGDKLKQVIVMRSDLGMRKGKMIAQGAHASVATVLKHINHEWVVSWLENDFTKICVRAESKTQLTELVMLAMITDVPVVMITDSGKTEFGGVPTITCAAIGPAPCALVDKITGDLRLL